MKSPFKEWLETHNGKISNDYGTLTGPQYLENRLYHAYSAGMLTEYEKTKQLQNTIDWYEKQLRELRAKVVSLEASQKDASLFEKSLGRGRSPSHKSPNAITSKQSNESKYY